MSCWRWVRANPGRKPWRKSPQRAKWMPPPFATTSPPCRNGCMSKTKVSQWAGNRQRYSSRFRWDLSPNRIARAVEQKRRDGASFIDLTESNPTRAGLHYPAEIVQSFTDERILKYEPAPA